MGLGELSDDICNCLDTFAQNEEIKFMLVLIEASQINLGQYA
jgi:hypothetical protein